MKRTFIIDGERIELTVVEMTFSNDIHDITAVGKLMKEWTHSGKSQLELLATTADGTEVKGFFKVLSQPEEGVLEITPWSNFQEIGDGV